MALKSKRNKYWCNVIGRTMSTWLVRSSHSEETRERYNGFFRTSITPLLSSPPDECTSPVSSVCDDGTPVETGWVFKPTVGPAHHRGPLSHRLARWSANNLTPIISLHPCPFPHSLHGVRQGLPWRDLRLPQRYKAPLPPQFVPLHPPSHSSLLGVVLRMPWEAVANNFDLQLWVNVYTMETIPNECLAQVRALLSHRSNVDIARRFQGGRAQTFIDILDRVLAQPQGLNDKFRQRCLRLLSKICKARDIIPTLYILPLERVRVGTVRCGGGFADVFDGEYLGRTVAIKRLRTSERDSDKAFKWLCREVIAWKYWSHPNVLPFLGVHVSADRHCLSIFTEWMPNGNVVQYTRSNTKANRLQLLSEVMAGMAYLHGLKIVHGDLKGKNILVDGAGIARVADFGLMTMTDLSKVVLSETAAPPGGTFGWMSPELLDPLLFGSNGRPTRESDCYALGMVIYEVLAGLPPFHHVMACTPVLAVMRGDRPRKPLDAESLGFSDQLWKLVQLCWSESSSIRPTASQLFDYFSSASANWTPPPVYPAIAFVSPSNADIGSPPSRKTLPVVSQCVGTSTVVGGSLVFVVLSFFMCT